MATLCNTITSGVANNPVLVGAAVAGAVALSVYAYPTIAAYFNPAETRPEVLAKGLTINIPRQADIYEFTNQRGENDFEEVQKKINKFTIKSMEEFGISKSIPFLFFNELVKNSYDSFEPFLGQTSDLSIKTVVCLKEGRLIIKFKDNGQGFPDLGKGAKCEFNDQQEFIKKPDGCFGSLRIGLFGFVERVKQLGGETLIKNRKERGCSIYISFPASEKQNQGARTVIATTTAAVVSAAVGLYFYLPARK